MKYLSLLLLICLWAISVKAQQDTLPNGKVRHYTFVQQLPAFPGGEATLNKFLSHNIKYPAVAKKKGIEGTVMLEFIVNEDGSRSDISALNAVGGGCTEEAIRVVKLMPKWNPGIQDGKPIKVYFHLPVIFKLSPKK